MAADRILIGCGSAFDADRLDWPLELAESGLVDHMSFDCLADRSLAIAQSRRLEDDKAGYDLRLGRIVEAFAPFLRRGGTMVGNFGSANPEAGAQLAVDGLRVLGGFEGLRVGLITGDDVLGQVRAEDAELPEWGGRVSDLDEGVLVSAHAYIGAEAVIQLLERGCSFVIGGRIADPSLWVGPICQRLDWSVDDWDRVAFATAVGHLLECGVHATGGNFLDPPYRVLPDPVHLGLPYAEVADGVAVVSKLPGTGGGVTPLTMKTQLAYEIGDPANYVTPDVVADYSQAELVEVGPDRVRLTGITGKPRTDTLKVLVGLDLGWKAAGEMSLGGPGCVERARLSEEIARGRLARLGDAITELKTGIVGLDSLFGDRYVAPCEPAEVRIRVAARCTTQAAAATVLEEVAYLHFGAAGVGGGPMSMTRAIGVTPAYVPRSTVDVSCEVLEV